MSLLTRSNDALNVNPPVGNRHLTVHGSDWLWAVCAIYTFSFLVVVGLTFVARQGERIFHYLFTIALFTGAIAYFAMASDLGSVAIHIADNLSSPGYREIFYARYINWYASLSSSPRIEFRTLDIDCLQGLSAGPLSSSLLVSSPASAGQPSHSTSLSPGPGSPPGSPAP